MCIFIANWIQWNAKVRVQARMQLSWYLCSLVRRRHEAKLLGDLLFYTYKSRPVNDILIWDSLINKVKFATICVSPENLWNLESRCQCFITIYGPFGGIFADNFLFRQKVSFDHNLHVWEFGSMQLKAAYTETAFKSERIFFTSLLRLRLTQSAQPWSFCAWKSHTSDYFNEWPPLGRLSLFQQQISVQNYLRPHRTWDERRIRVL